MDKYYELQEFYHSLSKHLHLVNFNNGALRDSDHHGRLERPFFAVAALLAMDADVSRSAYSILKFYASYHDYGLT